MSFENKLAAALRVLASAGISRGESAPPLYRALWRLGVRVPPPHFCAFATTLVLTGSAFGASVGAIMWFVRWSHREMSFGMVGTVLFAGSLFGLLIAGHYRRDARRRGIPLWRDFRPLDEDTFA